MTAQNFDNLKKIKNTQWHFIIWTLVVLILLITLLINHRLTLFDYLLQANQKPLNNSEQIETVKDSEQVATLSLEINSSGTESAALTVGKTYSTQVVLDTKNKVIIGSDAVLSYDPSIIEVSSIEEGSIFPRYPSVDFSQESGKIIISAVAPPGQEFTGNGLLATIYFKALKAGSSEFKFKFNPGYTNDSNVTETNSAKDLLGTANNLPLTIE